MLKQFLIKGTTRQQLSYSIFYQFSVIKHKVSLKLSIREEYFDEKKKSKKSGGILIPVCAEI